MATMYEVLFEGRDNYLATSRAGGVVQVRDGQLTWYTDEATFDEAVEYTKLVDYDDEDESMLARDAYSDFCNQCPGEIGGGDRAALILMAKYAADAYGLSTEEGRCEALVEVFYRDEDYLAQACQIVDMISDGVEP